MGMFDRISFQDANPVLSGVNSTQELMRQALLNQNQRVANQYQPQNLAEALKQAQLQNGLDTVKLQYAPQTAQAGINNTNANTGLMGAQTNLTNTKNRFEPLQNVIEAMRAQQQTSRFGQAYQLKSALQSMAPAARDTWISQHADEYNDMINTMANKANQQQDSMGSNILNQMMGQMFPQQGGAQQQGGMQRPGMMQAPPQQQGPQLSSGNDSDLMQELSNNPSLMQAMMAQGGNNQQQPMQQQQPGMQQAAPNAMPNQDANVDQLKRALQLSANKSLTTASTQRQNEAVTQIDSMLSDPGFRERAKNASLYAGALGKGGAFVDALSQQNPKAYLDYLTFMNNDVTWLSNRIKSADNMAGTDAQREELHNAFSKAINPATSNPEMFMSQIDNLQKSLHTLSTGVQKSANPIFDTQRERPAQYGNSSSSASKQYSDADLQHTAEKHGMTVEQVKQKLGIS